MVFRKSRKRIPRGDIDPGDVLLDARNLPSFDTQQFEGVIERPLSRNVFWFASGVLVLIAVVFCGRLIKLQIGQHGKYAELAEENRFMITPIFPERGVIYDRQGKLLAWNGPNVEGEEYASREFLSPGFSHIVGAVSYPKRDARGRYWQYETHGAQGTELRMDETLVGKRGAIMIETDVAGNQTGAVYRTEPTPGENVTLTIDADIQKSLAVAIADRVEQVGYNGGSGVIMDLNDGAILAMTSYPEYNQAAISLGTDRELIRSYNTLGANSPFLNRTLAGTFPPGSTIKPFLALGALQEGLITPATTVYSSGKIEIPNRYGGKSQLFRDWRPEGHGTTNVYHAIADSVNTYFYAIGGGFGGQAGLGISRIEKYTRMFGFGAPTGIDIPGEKSGSVPSPSWKERVFKGDAWRLGDTYNSSIGQFGFSATPTQLLRAVGAIATRGKLIHPYTVKTPASDRKDPELVTGVDDKWYDVMHDAMRQTVTVGTAQSMNVSYASVAAKTGTAQVGPGNRFVTSWVIGYFPVEAPRYAFAITLDYADADSPVGAAPVMARVLSEIYTSSPEDLGLPTAAAVVQ
jgi:penicillin-binding protein 2